jgi:hypothetical protein
MWSQMVSFECSPASAFHSPGGKKRKLRGGIEGAPWIASLQLD